MLRSSVALLLMACLALANAQTSPAQGKPLSPAEAEFFENQVRPLLVEHCFKCHGGRKTKAELNLTTRAGLLAGGINGPAAVPGKPKESLFLKAISFQDDDLRMPKDGKLKDRDIAIFTRWVEMGLPWPQTKGEATNKKGFTITEEQRHFWSFQPVKKPSLPDVKNARWVKSDIDRFILTALEGKGLSPAKAADRRTLIRRATFDLIGLPPTPEEVDAFLKDETPEAFAKVVDRLLGSRQYGERWGRHWLDVVRYADSFDSRGIGGTGDIAEAWRYRDWIVDAFNKDMPYDEFVIHQIAGDLLPARKQPGGIVATGVLAIGNWGGGDADKEKMHTDIVDDQIDVVTRSFLGLTVTCARCHDHKFDPISTQDYYGLAGIFFSTHILPNVGPRTAGPEMLRISLLTAADDAKRSKVVARQAELEKELKAARLCHYAKFVEQQAGETAKYLLATHDFRSLAAQNKVSVAEFAAKHELMPFALERWLDATGPAADYELMTQKVKGVLGKRGIDGYRGKPDTPSLLVNSTGDDVSILTFRLPAKSVAVHPGPKNGVVVSWKSPADATIKITGKVIDADVQCGDGIAWIIDYRHAAGFIELASGEFANGGKQDFAESKGGETLRKVEVKAGDQIQLLVLPKASHDCDTTIVEFTIATVDGKTSWNLAADIIDNIHDGNPHADRHGNADVWSFLDMAQSKRWAGGAGTLLDLGPWRQTSDDVRAGRKGRAALEQAALTIQKSLKATDAKSPFWIFNPTDEKHLPAAARDELAKLAAELDIVNKTPLPKATFAHGAQEGGIPGTMYAGFHDAKVHHRGSYLRLGAVVPRRFPVILAGEEQTPIKKGSGRMELARWIASSEHPLTARVLVNRLWQHHFGEGIVRTPSNFGKLGEAPTHPELLDYLAAEFVASGWSIKKMHRLIMLSAAYQQSSQPSAEALRLDPENRLFSRFNRRRLEAEAIRDNILAVSGQLDLKAGGPATRDFASPRRTLYQMAIRSDRGGFGPLFDTPDSAAITEKRIDSTVAPQALFLLNDPFILIQTQALAKRIMKSAKEDRISMAYAILYGREPTAAEARIGREFLGDDADQRTWEEYCQVLLCANEFVYVD